LKKAIVYNVEQQIAVVTVQDGELVLESDSEIVKKKILGLKNNYSFARNLSNEEFLDSLPARLRGQIYCEIVDG
jgi:hypothetical protein